MRKREHILCIDKTSIQEQLNGNYNKMISDVFIHPDNVFIGSRERLDKKDGIGDRQFLQPIGYVVINNPEKGYLAYRRKGGEGRLNGKISIGFGGHTSAKDLCFFSKTEEVDIFSTVEAGMEREIEEEIIFSKGDKSDFSTNFQGVIVCDKTDVDLLHIGFVYLKTYWSKEIEVTLGDHGLELFWVKELSELDYDNCEEWTKIIIDSKSKESVNIDKCLELIGVTPTYSFLVKNCTLDEKEKNRLIDLVDNYKVNFTLIGSIASGIGRNVWAVNQEKNIVVDITNYDCW